MNVKTLIIRIKSNNDLRSNGLLAFSSTVVTVVIGIVSTPILAFLLPRPEFGTLAFINSLTGILASISLPGVLSSIAYSVARGYEGVFEVGTWKRLRYSYIMSIVLIPVAAWYYWIENNQQLGYLIILAIILSPISTSFDTGEQLLVGRSDFRTLFFRRIAVALAITLFGLAAAFYSPSATVVYLAKTGSSALLMWLVFLYLNKTLRNRNIDPEFWLKTKKFNTLSIISGIAKQVDKIMLGLMGSLENLAALSVSLLFVIPIEMLGKSAIKLIYARLNKERSIEERRLYVKLTTVFILFGIMLAYISWGMIDSIVNTMFPKYPDITPFILVLIITYLFYFANILASTYCLFHQFNLWSYYNIWANLTKIPFTIILVIEFDIWGAIHAKLIFATIEYIYFSYIFWFNFQTKIK